MSEIRTFSDVPLEKVNQLVKDLEFELDKDCIKVTQVPETGKYQVDVVLKKPEFTSNIAKESPLRRRAHTI